MARTSKVLASIWANTDNLTKWIQVVALVFAAVWTFLTFRETEAPSFETPAGISAKIDWKLTPTGICSMTATFEVADKSVRSFDVARARVRAWRSVLLNQPTGYQYLDISSLENRIQPFSDFDVKSSLDSPLIGHYGPQTDLHHGFSWLLYGPPSSDLFVARIDVYNRAGELMGEASAWNLGTCM